MGGTLILSGFYEEDVPVLLEKADELVIANMPGLSVAGNGTITYQGKAINKFYIEGMDLMGNKYMLLSFTVAPVSASISMI